MKLAIVVSTFPPYRAGMGNAAATQARLLSERGFLVTVFTPDYGRQDKEEQGGSYPYEVVRVKPRASYGNAAWVPNFRVLTSGYDAVLLHYPFFGGLESFVFKKAPPLFVYYHMDAVGRGWMRILFALHRKFFLKRLIARARMVLASTEDYARHSKLRPFIEALKGRLVFVPFSVDTKSFTPSERPVSLLQKHAFSASNPVALFVGSLDRAHYFKGLAVLFEAWKQVMATAYEARLVIVGDGDMRPHYEALVKQYHLEQGVVFAGAVSDDELVAYYQLANVLTLPSIDRSEAFGLVVIEAMASGRAVVASRLPGVSSVVREGETGYMFPPGSVLALSKVLRQLLMDKELAGHFGARGREIAVREYSEQVVGDRLASAIRSAL